jgi:hypothetical protein
MKRIEQIPLKTEPKLVPYVPLVLLPRFDILIQNGLAWFCSPLCVSRSMPSLFTSFFLLLALVAFPSSLHSQDDPSIFSAEATKDAAKLVQEMRQLMPEQDSEITATLHIRQGQAKKDIPLKVIVTQGTNSWRTRYVVGAVSGSPVEEFVVLRTEGGINTYLHGRSSDGSPVILSPVSGEQLETPLAGSDFTLAALGIDFIHWPQQQLFKPEMRLGQPCIVLESRRPGTNGMVRVKSWIDRRSGGILIAEGYNSARELVKDFSLSGSGFVKINGQWQLKEMKIRSPQARSQTTLEFDLPGE